MTFRQDVSKKNQQAERAFSSSVPRNKSILVLLVFALSMVLVMSNLPGLSSVPGLNSLSLTKHAAYADLSADIEFFDGLEITNTQSASTPAPFQQWINMSLSGFSLYSVLRSDLGNIRFCTDAVCSTMLNAWLEGCQPSCNQYASYINVWLKLPEGIPAQSNATVFFTVFNSSTTFQSPYWGEAPEIGGAQPVVQECGGGGTTSSPKSCTFPNPVTSGDTIVIAGECAAGGSSCSSSLMSPSDSLGDSGWTQIAVSPSGNALVQVWYASITSSGSDTATITISGGTVYNNIFAYELTSVSTSSIASSTGSGTSGCCSVSSFSLNPFTLEFALTNSGNSGFESQTPSAGFRACASNCQSSGSSYQSAWSTSPTTGTSTLSISDSSYSEWAEVGVSLNLNFSASYGEYDNGQSVFTRYDNFEGDTLNSSWILNDVTAVVDDGITITPTQQAASFSTNSITWNVSEYNQNVVGEADATMQEGIGVGFQISDSTSGSTSTNQNLNMFDTTNSLSYICYIYQNPSGYSGMNDPCYSSPSWTAGNYYVESTSRASNGTGQIMLNYHRVGTTESDYGPSTVYFQVGDWLSSVSVSAYWARLRAEPPNNVMPSVSSAYSGIQSIESTNNSGNMGYVTNNFYWSQRPVISSCTSFITDASCGGTITPTYEIIIDALTSGYQNGEVQASVLLNVNNSETISIGLSSWSFPTEDCLLEQPCFFLQDNGYTITTPTNVNVYTDCLQMSIFSPGYTGSSDYQFTFDAWSGSCGSGTEVYTGPLINLSSDGLGNYITDEGLSVVGNTAYSVFTHGTYYDNATFGGPTGSDVAAISADPCWYDYSCGVFLGTDSVFGGGSNMFQSFYTGIGTSEAVLVGGVPVS
jgi:hypothetical protein